MDLSTSIVLGNLGGEILVILIDRFRFPIELHHIFDVFKQTSRSLMCKENIHIIFLTNQNAEYRFSDKCLLF